LDFHLRKALGGAKRKSGSPLDRATSSPRVSAASRIARCALRAPGVRVTGARIDGPLDLADCDGNGGGALPGLALEACDLTAGADLSNARLARLSLRDSCIREVTMRGMRLDGPLDIAGVHAAAEDAPAWIDAHGAVIRGELRGHGAKLRVLPEPRIVIPGQQRYALRLSDALIDGSVDLVDGFEAIGGVPFGGARIRGDCYAIGARMQAGEGDALRAQAASIDGVMLLDRLETTGVVWLQGAKIGASLQCNGATLRNKTDDGNGRALAAGDADIGGAVLLGGGFSAEGCVSLLSAAIGGTLACDGATLRSRTDNGDGVALAVENAKIGGAVLLRDDFTAEGCVSLRGAAIGSSLECDGATLRNRTERGAGAALAADDAEIGGAVLLRDGFTAEGCVSLLGAKIGRDMECSTARLRNEARSWMGFSLVQQDARIGGRLRCDQGFTSLGRAILWGCRIGGDMICTGGQFVAPPPPRTAASLHHIQSAVDAINLRVEGDVILDDTAVLGLLTFEHATITGSLRWVGSGSRTNCRRSGRSPAARRRTPKRFIEPKSAEDSLAGRHLPSLADRRCDKHDILPLFYALDMMLPVIPLHQEDRCEVASRTGTEGWQIVWAVFSISGKIVTSLTLLTYAGVLKPKED
jgi:hypothetical protein